MALTTGPGMPARRASSRWEIPALTPGLGNQQAGLGLVNLVTLGWLTFRHAHVLSDPIASPHAPGS